MGNRLVELGSVRVPLRALHGTPATAPVVIRAGQPLQVRAAHFAAFDLAFPLGFFGAFGFGALSAGLALASLISVQTPT